MFQTLASRLKRMFSRDTVIIEVPRDVHLDAAAVSAEATRLLMTEIIKTHRSEHRWRIAKRGLYALSLLLGMYLSLKIANPEMFELTPMGSKAAIVDIRGGIMSGSPASADEVIPALRKAFEDSTVKAVILRIDSGGGAPWEAERINAAIKDLRAKNDKPLVAVINTLGASAAYMIALQADSIYAGRYSLVGSIGAVMANWDLSRTIARVDVQRRIYASGELKAALDPFMPSTAKGNAWAQGIVDEIGTMFTKEVMEKRGAKLQPGTAYDTGEVWNGVQAHQLGLVDAIGTQENAIEALSTDEKLTPVPFGPARRNRGFLGNLQQTLKEAMVQALTDVGTAQPQLQ